MFLILKICRVLFSNAPNIGIKRIFLFYDELKVRWKTAPYGDPIDLWMRFGFDEKNQNCIVIENIL